ncbi:SPOR domain-containing protein [Virgibacillus ainsalahensis]
MDKKRITEISENGKQIKMKLNNPADKEQAATVQDAEDDPIPVFVRPVKKKNTTNKKQNKSKSIKPVLLASISAIVIGSILGVVMLRMVTGIEGEAVQGDGTPPVTVGTGEEDESPTESSEFTLKQMEAYVLQGGVFSESANAKEWADKYNQAGLPNIIWQRDNQYFLLVGIAGTKDEAKQLINTMESYQFDVFSKEWTTDQKEVELSANEQDWLQSFQEQWVKTVNASNNEEIDTAGWEKLMEDYPEDGEKLMNLNEEVSSLQEEVKQDEMILQQKLLSLWLEYDKIK